MKRLDYDYDKYMHYNNSNNNNNIYWVDRRERRKMMDLIFLYSK